MNSKVVLTAVLLCALSPSIFSKPLKVFILAGQSNMQGHVNVSTFDSMADDPKTAPMLKEMRTAAGKPKVCNKVWISSIGCADDDTTEQKGKLTTGYGASRESIGPEFTYGIFMEKALDEPILIIKTAWGGRSLHTDFRSPGSGPYAWSDFELNKLHKRGDDMAKTKAEKIEATGLYYRLMLDHVKKVLSDIKNTVPSYNPRQGYEIAGFVWFQGFNDMVSDWTYETCEQPGGYDLYSTLLAQFIRDVRKDLNTPQMPFIIGVMGINGEKEGKTPGMQMVFRHAQSATAALPEFKGNVTAVPTALYWDDELQALEDRKQTYMPEVNAKAEAENDTSWENKAKHLEKKYSPTEWKKLKGMSNGGYHYLGAAKIMAPIGKAFAETNLKLINQ